MTRREALGTGWKATDVRGVDDKVDDVPLTYFPERDDE